VEADAGGKGTGGDAATDELHRLDKYWQGRESDDDFRLPGGAGHAGAVECVTAVSVSGRFEAGDAATDARRAECSSGDEESGAAVSVSR
jgi:hypothetical protein